MFRSALATGRLEAAVKEAPHDPNAHTALIAHLREALRAAQKEKGKGKASSQAEVLARKLHAAYAALSARCPLALSADPALLAQWEGDYTCSILPPLLAGQRFDDADDDEEEEMVVDLFKNTSSGGGADVALPTPPLLAVSAQTLLGLHAHACAGALLGANLSASSSSSSTSASLAATLYNNAVALWISAVDPTDLSTGESSDGLLPAYTFVPSSHPLHRRYSVSLDVGDAAAVRTATKHIAALASVLGAATVDELCAPPNAGSGNDNTVGTTTNVSGKPIAPAALWFDIHRGLLEIGGEDCCRDGANTEAAEEEVRGEDDENGGVNNDNSANNNGNSLSETLTKRSFVASLRAPYADEPFMAAISDAYAAFGDKRAAKTSAGLLQGTDRKKLVASRGAYGAALRQLVGSLYNPPSSNNNSNKGTPPPHVTARIHQSFSKAAVAHGWDIARLCDGVAGHCFLAHASLTILFLCGLRGGGGQREKEKLTFPIAMDEHSAAFVESLFPSLLKYAAKGLAFGQRSSAPSSSAASPSIAAAGSLCDVGACLDVDTIIIPLFAGTTDLIRLVGGAGGAVIVTPEVFYSPPSQKGCGASAPTVGQKRPREKTDAGCAEDNDGGEEGEADEEEEEEEVPPPLLGESALRGRLSEACLALLSVIAEATVIGHGIRKSPTVAAKANTLLRTGLYGNLLPLLTVSAPQQSEDDEEREGEANVAADDVQSPPQLLLRRHPAIGFLPDDEAESPTSLLDRRIAALRIHLAITKTFAPLAAPNAVVRTDADGPFSLAAAISRHYSQSLLAATAEVQINGYADVAAAAIADAAFLVTARLSTVAALVVPTLAAAPNAAGAEMLKELAAALESATGRWEGILRRLRSVRKEGPPPAGEKGNESEGNSEVAALKAAQHSALIRRVIAKAEDVVSALLDFRLNAALMPPINASSVDEKASFATPMEVGYLFASLGKLSA